MSFHLNDRNQANVIKGQHPFYFLKDFLVRQASYNGTLTRFGLVTGYAPCSVSFAISSSVLVALA